MLRVRLMCVVCGDAFAARATRTRHVLRPLVVRGCVNVCVFVCVCVVCGECSRYDTHETRSAAPGCPGVSPFVCLCVCSMWEMQQKTTRTRHVLRTLVVLIERHDERMREARHHHRVGEHHSAVPARVIEGDHLRAGGGVAPQEGGGHRCGRTVAIGAET